MPYRRSGNFLNESTIGSIKINPEIFRTDVTVSIIAVEHPDDILCAARGYRRQKGAHTDRPVPPTDDEASTRAFRRAM